MSERIRRGDTANTTEPQTAGEEDHVLSQWLSPRDAYAPDQRAAYVGGNPHITFGSSCDNAPEDTRCFLLGPQRDRLIDHISRRLLVVQANYKAAIAEVKFQELLKKDDDLHWAAAFALDIVGAHLTAAIGNTLKALQKAQANRLADLQVKAALTGMDEGRWVSLASRALAMAAPTRIDTYVRLGMGLAMPKAKAGGKAIQNDALDNHATKTRKAETIGFLDQLRDKCDVGFEAIFTNLAAYADDAELLAAYEALDPTDHSTGLYVEMLQAKIAELHASGVTKIGREEIAADAYGGKAIRDTRVVYVQDINGNKTPWYQHADGTVSTSGARLGDPLYEQIDPSNADHKQRWRTFGPRGAADPKLDRPVPEEFREIAIARSEARWGPTPVFDDGYVALLKLNGVDVGQMRQRISNGLPAPSSAHVEDDTSWIAQRNDAAQLPKERP